MNARSNCVLFTWVFTSFSACLLLPRVTRRAIIVVLVNCLRITFPNDYLIALVWMCTQGKIIKQLTVAQGSRSPAYPFCFNGRAHKVTFSSVFLFATQESPVVIRNRLTHGIAPWLALLDTEMWSKSYVVTKDTRRSCVLASVVKIKRGSRKRYRTLTKREDRERQRKRGRKRKSENRGVS